MNKMNLGFVLTVIGLSVVMMMVMITSQMARAAELDYELDKDKSAIIIIAPLKSPNEKQYTSYDEYRKDFYAYLKANKMGQWYEYDKDLKKGTGFMDKTLKLFDMNNNK